MTRSITLLALSLLAVGCGDEAPERPDTMSLSADTLVLSEEEPEGIAGTEDFGVVEVSSVLGEEDAGPPTPEATSEIPDIASVEITVISGENLVMLAEWADCSVEELAAVNGIDPRDPLIAGQGLKIPAVDEGAFMAFEAARNGATDRRLERYLSRRGGLVGVDEHSVRTGETAWEIAHDQAGIPTWVLAAFNRGEDLDRLSIGDRLRVPVLGDTVADAATVDEAGDPIDMAVERDEADVAAEPVEGEGTAEIEEAFDGGAIEASEPIELESGAE